VSTTTVWVVILVDYEQTWPSAVFSTEAAAKAYADRRNTNTTKASGRECGDWQVFDFPLRTDDGTTDPTPR
jgi:hypothetical protein